MCVVCLACGVFVDSCSLAVGVCLLCVESLRVGCCVLCVLCVVVCSLCLCY